MRFQPGCCSCVGEEPIVVCSTFCRPTPAALEIIVGTVTNGTCLAMDCADYGSRTYTIPHLPESGCFWQETFTPVPCFPFLTEGALAVRLTAGFVGGADGFAAALQFATIARTLADYYKPNWDCLAEETFTFVLDDPLCNWPVTVTVRPA